LSGLIQTKVLLYKMLWFNVGGARWSPAWLFYLMPLVLIGHAIGAAWGRPTPFPGLQRWIRRCVEAAGWTRTDNPVSGPCFILHRITAVGTYVNSVWLLAIFYFSATDVNPFIYFKF